MSRFLKFGSSRCAASLAVLLVLATAGQAQAQHEGHGAPPAKAQDPGACTEGGRQALQIVDALAMRVEAARQTNRAADLRGAVADVQASLANLRTQLAPCEGALQGPGGSAPAIQPDCGGAIDPDTAPKTEYKGTVYYFCSEGNRQTFLANPDKYIGHHHQ